MVELLWETVLSFIKELKIELLYGPYGPTISLLGMYPREMKAYIHTETCRQVLIAALFLIAKR